MENTSKALIVAGSIILAILLVSLGMYIYNISNQGDLSGNTALQMKLTNFNSQYEFYQGTINGKSAKYLLDLAARNNQELYADETATKYVVCICSNSPLILNHYDSGTAMRSGLDRSRGYGVKYPSNIRDISSHIKNSYKFNVWFRYNDFGYICEINLDSI